MTTIYNEKITCCLCGKKSEHRGIGSTNAFGSPDLDTRPPEMQRSTMFAWVQRCPHCGYCSSDITKVFEKKKTQSLIESGEYQSQLKDRTFPDMANSFLCKSMIAEKEERFSEAAWAMIHTVWTCDDAGYEEASKKMQNESRRTSEKRDRKGGTFCKAVRG